MRKDKKKNLEKIAVEIMKDPFLTARELVEKTWLWLWTAHRALKEVERTGTKDDRIINLTETDLHIVRLSQLGILEKLNDEKERKKMKAYELAQVSQVSEKRYSTFRWSVTDEQWWLNAVSEDRLYDEVEFDNDNDD